MLLSGEELRDVGIRNFAIHTWVNAIADELKQDDGSEKYAQAIQPHIDRIREATKGYTRHTLLQQLGDTVLSQRKVSHCEGM